MFNYEDIKALAKQMKRPVTSLIALAPQNDPFYVGTDRDWRMGQWFANLWKRFGYTTGVHIRRMHYAVVSQNPPVIMPNGKPYENTEACWIELVQAAKCARYLELVDPAAFVDRRNGEPLDHINYVTKLEAEASVPTPGIYDDELEIPEFPDLPDYSLNRFTSPQRYHLEVWCEKSTMNDILDGLARRYNAVLQYGMGELSITVALEAIRRFERSAKPVRIFYVSDFDPAGAGMPVSMSRKLEYFIHKEELDIDVKLFPVVLTHEQVKHYNRLLPTPIKDSERRKAKFEERYGGGAVELDALEALYPDELRKILAQEMSRYHDSDLSRRVWKAEIEAQARLDEAKESVHAEFEDEIAVLEAEHDAMAELLSERMASYSQRKQELWQAISERLEEELPDITKEDVPEADEAEERDGALYDSERDYLEQNAVYQEYKGKDTYEELSA